MADPITGWLSYVGLLLALCVPIAASLAVILRHADDMLGSVLSMCDRVRRFRRGMSAPVEPRKRVSKPPASKRNIQGHSRST